MVKKAVILGAAFLLAAAAGWAMWPGGGPTADPDDPAQVAAGRQIYATHCASCHGERLEGETEDWRARKPNGRLPAPPHDETGHTWHHPDRQLFEITKHGPAAVVGGGYESDMPAFAGTLDDEEIWAVLAYIKSTWPQRLRAAQAARNGQ